jgi:hypothetical protein
MEDSDKDIQELYEEVLKLVKPDKCVEYHRNLLEQVVVGVCGGMSWERQMTYDAEVTHYAKDAISQLILLHEEVNHDIELR